MQKNDVVRVAIEDMSHKGEGIGKADGYPLFIKDAVIGDELEVIVTKAGKSYGYGRIAKVWKPSPYRCQAWLRFSRSSLIVIINYLQFLIRFSLAIRSSALVLRVGSDLIAHLAATLSIRELTTFALE